MKWPLNVDNFTFLDRLKICSFILNKNNKWTQAEKVKLFEKNMASYVGSSYAVFCSSGSTANSMIAMSTKQCTNFSSSVAMIYMKTLDLLRTDVT